MTTCVKSIIATVQDQTKWVNSIRTYLEVLEEMGLVRTDDTGQLDLEDLPRPVSWGVWTTKPAVFRFDDTLQATHPIFVIFNFDGNGSYNTLHVRIRVTSGTDGASNPTDFVIGRSDAVNSVAPVLRTLYGCHTEGFAGLGSPSGPNYDWFNGAFLISRTCDSNGEATGDGVMVRMASSNSSYRACIASVRYNTEGKFESIYYSDFNQTGPDPQTVSLCPPGFRPSIEGEISVFLMFGAFPQIQPLKNMCLVPTGTMGVGDTFNVALVGNTERTYLHLGPHGFCRDMNAEVLNYAMIWE